MQKFNEFIKESSLNREEKYNEIVKQVQAAQSIMLSERDDREIQCNVIYEDERYRVFIIAVYTDKYEDLGIPKDTLFDLYIDLLKGVKYYVKETQEECIAKETKEKTLLITTQDSSLYKDISEFTNNWIEHLESPKKLNPVLLTEIFNELNEIWNKWGEYGAKEIEPGHHIPELHSKEYKKNI